MQETNMLVQLVGVHVQVYGSVPAGSYRFSVMLAGQAGNQAAQALFQILTEGPSVNITVPPANPSTGQVVAFKFVSEAAAYFQCRWVNVTASTVDSYANCKSPEYVPSALLASHCSLSQRCMHKAATYL